MCINTLAEAELQYFINFFWQVQLVTFTYYWVIKKHIIGEIFLKLSNLPIYYF